MAERNIVVRAIDYAKGKRLELAAAATLAPAAFLGGCGGKEGGTQVTFIPHTPTATAEASTATATAIPTNTPEPTVEPTATAIPVDPIIDRAIIKNRLTEVYANDTLPTGLCSLDMVTGLVDEVFEIYERDRLKSPSGAMATVYAQLVVFAEDGDNAQAEELAGGIREGVKVLIRQNLELKSLPAGNFDEVFAAWERNVQMRLSEIKIDSNCDINLVPQDKRAKQ